VNFAEGERVIVKADFGFKLWEILFMTMLSLATGFLAILFYIDYSKTKKSEAVLTDRRLIGTFRTGMYGHKLVTTGVLLSKISNLKIYNKLGMSGFVFECPQGKFTCGHVLNIEKFGRLLQKQCEICK